MPGFPNFSKRVSFQSALRVTQPVLTRCEFDQKHTHPVRIARIRCPRFVPRIGLPRHFFSIGNNTHIYYLRSECPRVGSNRTRILDSKLGVYRQICGQRVAWARGVSDACLLIHRDLFRCPLFKARLIISLIISPYLTLSSKMLL